MGFLHDCDSFELEVYYTLFGNRNNHLNMRYLVYYFSCVFLFGGNMRLCRIRCANNILCMMTSFGKSLTYTFNSICGFTARCNVLRVLNQTVLTWTNDYAF